MSSAIMCMCTMEIKRIFARLHVLKQSRLLTVEICLILALTLTPALEAAPVTGGKDRVRVGDPTADILVTVTKAAGPYLEPWQLNENVCPPSICTSSEENRPRGSGGSVFYNGDIVLDNEAADIIYGSRSFGYRRPKRATSRAKNRQWPGGVVAIVFAKDILAKSKKYIKMAIRQIENNTCIRFRSKKLKDENYIRFISEPGCWSNVGRVGGEQKVSIGRGCERLGTAVHEISHTLGFWHEQARPDRDKYVRILEENVSPRYLPDFEKANTTLVTSRGFPYDYESVMHYSEKAFTNLGDPTIKVIGVGKKLKMRIGQRDELSTLDIAQIRNMYGCNDREDDNVTYCPKGWTKKGRSCYKFEVGERQQFAGAVRHCEAMNSHLLHIETKKEDKYIKRRLKKKYPTVKYWRTGGRLDNGSFVWYNGDGKTPDEMGYTKWRRGHPSSYSSMALVNDRKSGRVRWHGVWLGSAHQMPRHAYAVICERRSRRKCIKGRHKDGRDYRGTLDHTIDGITCQKWSSQYPHAHRLLPYPYTDTGTGQKDGLGDHNHCRNPSDKRRSRPWCYTTKRNYKWQYCDVSICQSNKQDTGLTVGSKPTRGTTTGTTYTNNRETNRILNTNGNGNINKIAHTNPDMASGTAASNKDLAKNKDLANNGVSNTEQTKDTGVNKSAPEYNETNSYEKSNKRRKGSNKSKDKGPKRKHKKTKKHSSKASHSKNKSRGKKGHRRHNKG